MNLILLTGMPGARKSDVAQLMVSYGNSIVNMSDIITQQLRSMHLNSSPTNYQEVARHMRITLGQDCLARLTIERLCKARDTIHIVDGIRTVAELEYFRAHSDCCPLVLVHASRLSRHERMRSRSGPELQTEGELKALDRHNIALGLAEVMAEADYVIVNGDYLGQSLAAATSLVYRAILNEWRRDCESTTQHHES